ncbi:putative Zinc knuckle [Seiridium cardinale]|uniref:Zinc knuckle n=1 Tax=Seiridium cardinale TaxID=138064 RepID=A0ABR2XYN5_9PEZI
MATLLRDPIIDNYDIIAIQEPWRNPSSATTHHPAKDRFHLCYPSSEERGPAIVCFFINKKLDHSRWQFRESSRDLCTLSIETGEGAQPPTVVHNIYNPSPREDDRSPTLQQQRKSLETHRHGEQIVVGDFNLHHELWGGSDIQAPDRETTELLDLMDDMNLISQLQPGTGRRPPDDYRPLSRHLTSLHLAVAERRREEKRKWKAMDEKKQSQPPTVTPEIKKPNTSQIATTPGEKAALFKETFFPPPPEASLEGIDNTSYSNQISLPPVSESEVEDAVQEAAPLKAPGPDGIPNLALQSLRLGYCPQLFRKSTTVVLWKPGKDNYTVPKAYRPIALLNTVGKIMNAIIARRLSYLAETHGLLPDSHMGGRKRRSTEHALHQIVDKIYEAWGSGKGMVVSLLLLDVSGAFDNVSHCRLLHDLRKRRIDEATVRWVASFLGCRETEINVDGFRSETYRINTGIPQGSPLSPILYLFYNADLLDSCNEAEDTTATGFINNVAILAVGDSTEETCQKLQEALRKAETWALTHASIFAPEKFQLTMRHPLTDTPYQPLRQNFCTILKTKPL